MGSARSAGGTLTLATFVSLSLVGCAYEPSPPVSSPPKKAASPSTGPASLPEGAEQLTAGTYSLDLDARGSGEELFPLIQITVPKGWASIDGWAVNSGESTDHWVGITFWDVDEVFAHPCRWEGRTIQPGPGVADLARVLARRPLRGATKPVDIKVDGFQGMQLEWSVPTDIEFSTCDGSDFRSWTAAADSWASVRYHQGAGQVDRLWILDVNGKRLVIDAMYMPTTDAHDREELWKVMESIRFEK